MCLFCSKSRIGTWLPGTRIFSSCVLASCWDEKKHVHHTLLLLLPQSPGPWFPQRELQCVSTSSLISVIGYCGLCPITSKPGLVEHLNSVGSYTLEFCSSLSSSPSSMLPPLRYYEFTPWGSHNFSVVTNWWHPLVEHESILRRPLVFVVEDFISLAEKFPASDTVPITSRRHAHVMELHAVWLGIILLADDLTLTGWWLRL